MKKNDYKWVLIISVCLITLGCKTSDKTVTIPECIENKIMDLKKEAIRNPPAEIWKWQSDVATYFYVTSDCCDQFNYLYDMNCKVVCAPDGGFTGKGDGKCPALGENVEKTLIWKDGRK